MNYAMHKKSYILMKQLSAHYNPLTNGKALSSCGSIHIKTDSSISMFVDKAVNTVNGFKS